mmetsp:Transcript_103799/g.175621  ORF Transcript_103799/g.175621 Transcript_103799/m.175621 type:complete len:86 (-) Transcript_103799:617-874(-)
MLGFQPCGTLPPVLRHLTVGEQNHTTPSQIDSRPRCAGQGSKLNSVLMCTTPGTAHNLNPSRGGSIATWNDTRFQAKPSTVGNHQ